MEHFIGVSSKTLVCIDWELIYVSKNGYLEYRDSWRQPGNADEKKKKNYHSESVFMCTKKEQSNFEYKVGSEPSGQETRDDSQETREGSLGEKTFVEDI